MGRVLGVQICTDGLLPGRPAGGRSDILQPAGGRGQEGGSKRPNADAAVCFTEDSGPSVNQISASPSAFKPQHHV